MRIVIATRNPGKLREVRAILRNEGLRFSGLSAWPGIPNLPEKGMTFEANAEAKAFAASRATGLISLADDSGLEVDALDGAPGIRSAPFAATDAKRIARLLRLLRDTRARARGAGFVCAVSVATPDGIVGTVRGTCRGRIATAPRGAHGFGYDPIFYLPRMKRTFAQLSSAQKNKVSHRGRALRKARKLLKKAVMEFKGSSGVIEGNRK